MLPCVKIGLLCLPLAFFACKNDGGVRNIEAYYFPLDKLEEGKVYEYQMTSGAEKSSVYWYYKSMKEGDSRYLLGMAYDTGFSPDQFVREERVDNGMLLADFIAYEADTTTGKKVQAPARIDAANVFPFEVKQPAGVLLSSVTWQSPLDSSVYLFVRNRQFDRDTSIVFQGKNYPAVVFNVRELVDHDLEGHWKQEYPATEIYAKGIGLVYAGKTFNDSLRLTYQLAGIYSMAVFEKKFRVTLEQQQ
jgi:hypothetical protein